MSLFDIWGDELLIKYLIMTLSISPRTVPRASVRPKKNNPYLNFIVIHLLSYISEYFRNCSNKGIPWSTRPLGYRWAINHSRFTVSLDWVTKINRANTYEFKLLHFDKNQNTQQYEMLMRQKETWSCDCGVCLWRRRDGR